MKKENIIPQDLVKFLDLNRLTKREKKDHEYISSIISNYEDYGGTKISDEDELDFAKQYSKL